MLPGVLASSKVRVPVLVRFPEMLTEPLMLVFLLMVTGKVALGSIRKTFSPELPVTRKSAEPPRPNSRSELLTLIVGPAL